MYTVKQKFTLQENICHIHCYKLSYINWFNKWLQMIEKYFCIIITFCEDDYIFDKYTQLQIPNKGMDIGAKILCIKYINDNMIDYKRILFLHSKSNIIKRNEYLNTLLIDEDNIRIMIEFNYDAVFPDCEHKNIGTWGINEYHILRLMKTLNISHKTYFFIEGNFYMLKKWIIERIFKIELYSMLNDINSFDYNWITKYYKLSLSYEKIYELFTLGKFKYGNNLLLGYNGLPDGMIEHAFERIIFNIILDEEYANVKIKKKKFLKKMNFLVDLNNENTNSLIETLSNMLKPQNGIEQLAVQDLAKVMVNLQHIALQAQQAALSAAGSVSRKLLENSYTFKGDKTFSGPVTFSGSVVLADSSPAASQTWVSSQLSGFLSAEDLSARLRQFTGYISHSDMTALATNYTEPGTPILLEGTKFGYDINVPENYFSVFIDCANPRAMYQVDGISAAPIRLYLNNSVDEGSILKFSINVINGHSVIDKQRVYFCEDPDNTSQNSATQIIPVYPDTGDIQLVTELFQHVTIIGAGINPPKVIITTEILKLAV